MEVNTLQANDAQTFFSNFLKNNPENSNESNNQNSSEGAGASGGQVNAGAALAVGATQGEVGKTQEELDKEKAEKEGSVQGQIDKGANAAGASEKEVSDFRELSEILIKDEFLKGFDDGSKVETPEDFKVLLQGNIEHQVATGVQEKWAEEIGSLSRDAQIILTYAKGGVADAKDFSKLINNLAASNYIATLDPTKEVDQAQIVKLKLLNTGLSEAAVNETIEDLKAAKKLEARAKELYPTIKKEYESQVQEQFKQKQQEEEARDNYIQNNASNVQFFLENEDKFLPFKIKDKGHKSLIFDLAAKPVGVDSQGDLIYAWQDYLQRLQNGGEDNYKHFMKIMTFIANSKNYDESVARTTANQVNSSNFKAKEAAGVKKVTFGSSQGIPSTGSGIRKPQSKNWSV